MLTVSFKKKSVKVATLGEASDVYSAARDKSGQGYRSWKDGMIRDETGAFVGRLSYNGNIWAKEDGRTWVPTDEPIFRRGIAA